MSTVVPALSPPPFLAGRRAGRWSGTSGRGRNCPGVDGRAAGQQAIVSVGPPLVAERSQPAVWRRQTRLPFVPLVSPPEPPVPIRLFVLDGVDGAGDIAGREDRATADRVERDDRVEKVVCCSGGEVQAAPAPPCRRCYRRS